jgi:hypothetical protein
MTEKIAPRRARDTVPDHYNFKQLSAAKLR